MVDVRDRYRRAARRFDAAVRAVPADQWGRQSPCEEWSARDVVDHVVSGHRSIIAGVRGGDPETSSEDESPLGAWTDVQSAMDELTGDPEAMATEIDGPVGRMPAGEVISRFVVMDTLVHTWDLAHSVGADERLDDELVREAYDALLPMDAMIRQPRIFGPRLEPPPDADLQTEFLYFLGRRA
jgi:uncharacterized protein (TIGR03086 family)